MKVKKELRITAFILVMIMLALFSAGTIMMAMPKIKKSDEGIAQFRTSGVNLELKQFEITTPTIKEGEKLRISVEATVDDIFDIEYYALWAKNTATGEVFYTTFDGPGLDEGAQTNDGLSNASPGTYTVTGLTLALEMKENKSAPYTYYYINVDNCNDPTNCTNEDMISNKTFTIGENLVEEEPFYEYVVSFVENLPKVTVGDQIKLSVQRVDPLDEIRKDRKTVKTMMLSYTNINGGDIVNMYVKRIDFKPYLIIPSTATPGRYVLNYGYLTFTDGTTEKYKNTEKTTFTYQSDFIVEEKKFDTSKYVFSNELYNNNIKEDLTKLDKDAIITVDANKAPVVDQEIFENIKGTEKTLIIEYDTSEWVFNGIDIKNPKSIDVSTIVSKLEKSNEYYDEFIKANVTSPSALLKFSNNGDLPGKVLIKIDSNSIDEYLKDPNNVYVYYYKEDSDQLVKVAMEIQKNEGFYEFYINHNSKYIVSSKEIKSKVVSDNVEMLALNGQISSSTSFPLVYVLATICGVLAMLLLIVSLSKGRSQSQQQTQES